MQIMKLSTKVEENWELCCLL